MIDDGTGRERGRILEALAHLAIGAPRVICTIGTIRDRARLEPLILAACERYAIEGRLVGPGRFEFGPTATAGRATLELVPAADFTRPGPAELVAVVRLEGLG